MTLPIIISILVISIVVFLIVYVSIDRKYTDKIVNLELKNKSLKEELKNATNKFESTRKSLNALKQDLDKKVIFIKDQNSKIFKLETELKDLDIYYTNQVNENNKINDVKNSLLSANRHDNEIADALISTTTNAFFNSNKTVYQAHVTSVLDAKMNHIPRNPFKFNIALTKKLFKEFDAELTEIATELDVQFRDYCLSVDREIKDGHLTKTPVLKWKDDIINSITFAKKVNKFVRENFDVSNKEHVNENILLHISTSINLALLTPARTIVNKLNMLSKEHVQNTISINSKLIIKLDLANKLPIFYIIPYSTYQSHNIASKKITSQLLK